MATWRKTLERFFSERDTFLAILGDGNGTVQSARSGYVIVRLANGQLLEVYNRSVPPIEGLLVRVGVKDKLTRRIEVLGAVDSPQLSGTPEGGNGGGTVGLPQHASTHGLFGSDRLFIDSLQIKPMAVIPRAGSKIVDVLAGFVVRPDGTANYFPGQTLDLSSYFPASGSRFVLLAYNPTSNSVDVIVGAVASTPFELTFSSIPPITDNRRPLAVVLLDSFAGSIVFNENRQYVMDLRGNDMRALSSGGSSGDAVSLRGRAIADPLSVNDGDTIRWNTATSQFEPARLPFDSNNDGYPDKADDADTVSGTPVDLSGANGLSNMLYFDSGAIVAGTPPMFEYIHGNYVRNTTLSVPSNTFTSVSYNIIVTQTHQMLQADNTTIVVPYLGVFIITVTVTWASSILGYRFANVNVGSTPFYDVRPASGLPYNTLTVMSTANAGSNIVLSVQQTSGASLNMTRATLRLVCLRRL